MLETHNTDIRPYIAADLFYPGQPPKLRATLDSLLSDVEPHSTPGKITALVSPHAGYMYSGNVAAAAYHQLDSDDYSLVAIVCPSHRERFDGISVFAGRGYQTPLGLVPVAQDTAAELIASDDTIFASWQGHLDEHALEVQLPFLSFALGEFELLPISLGKQDFETCARLGKALARVLEDKRALIVASSDLSHYLDYDSARQTDLHTLSAIAKMDAQSFVHELYRGECQACGGGAIAAVMIASQEAGADRFDLIKYQNSGDVDDRRNRVVGYASGAFYQAN